MISSIFDWLATLLAILPMVGLLTVRGRMLGEIGKKATAIFSSIFAMYLMRLGYLRIVSNGGNIAFSSVESNLLTQILGSSYCFFALSFALMVSYYYRSREVQKETAQAMALRAALLKMGLDLDELTSTNKPYHVILKRIEVPITEPTPALQSESHPWPVPGSSGKPK